MVGAGVDLISELTDDQLLRILSFLPAASDAARTSALSRRWRHLWPNAVALRFAVGSEPNFNNADGDISRGARRLIAGADVTLARRGASGGLDVEDLELSFIYTSNVYLDCSGRYLLPHHHAADIMPAHVDSWLRFPAQYVIGRFTIAVPIVVDEEEEGFAAAMEEDVASAALEEEVVDDEPMPEPNWK
ncbi:unnamed protein product [Urochloa humidicola]